MISLCQTNLTKEINMSTNNMAEFEEKTIYIKRESGGSNYDKQPDGNSNHGKTKWIVVLVVCFITFFYGIFSFVNDLPFKIPFVLLFPAWVGAAISILKINKINQQYGIKDSILSSSYNSEQHLERLQRNQQSFASFKGCLADLFKNHIFLAIPIVCFFGTVLAEMLFLFNIDDQNGRIKEKPTSFKELVCLLFKNHPIYGISLALVVLASPFILYNLLSGMSENSSLLYSGFIMLFPAMIITNFVSGFVGFPFVFANAILATFQSMLKK